MDASSTLSDSMTLLEKLAKIDEMIKNAQDKHQEQNLSRNRAVAPLDPADLTICDGCE